MTPVYVLTSHGCCVTILVFTVSIGNIIIDPAAAATPPSNIFSPALPSLPYTDKNNYHNDNKIVISKD
jgi:hypothetical protein